MIKRTRPFWIPFAALMTGIAFVGLSGPTLGFASRMAMSTTGGKYLCTRCNESTGKYETEEKSEDLSGKDGWHCKSIAPVNFFTGENAYSQSDLSVKGLSGWGLNREYLSTPAHSDGGLGPCWRFGEFLRLLKVSGQIWIISGNSHLSSFIDNGNGTYTPDFNYTSSLTSDAVNHLLIYSDTRGRRWLFFDFSGSWSTARQGRLKQHEDAGGNITTTIYGTSGVTNDKVIELQQTDTNPALLHRMSFSYNLSGASVGLLSSIAYSQSVSGVSTTVRNVTYAYYTVSGPNGPAGTLQRVRVADGAGAVLDTTYYRYGAFDAGGWMPLRYAVQPTAYERLFADLGSDAAIDAASDATIAPYADYFFQYVAGTHTVQSETVSGQGCNCGTSGGRGVFTYAITSAAHGAAAGPNVWSRKNVMSSPDGNLRTVYMNGVGQTMLEVYKDVASGFEWRTYWRFNTDNSTASVAFASAVTGHDETLPGLVSSAHLPDAAGLWHLYEYYATTNLPAGAVAKHLSAAKIRQGELGTAVLLQSNTFTSRSGTGGTIYPLAGKTVYRNTNGTGGATTSFSYTWQGSTDQMLQKTTTHPVVTAAQNGSGAATATTAQFDPFGRKTWLRDEDGFIHAWEYGTLTGAVTLKIVDVNTAVSANEPAGWTTPAGGGLHLTTTTVVDALGRVTKSTDPGGDVTYSVFRDPQREVRIYPGWQSATNTTTGPTQMLRVDRTRSYRELLTMSAAPAVTGGVPTGTEAVSALQTLQREYLDAGHRVTYADSYFNFSGLTYSTAINIGTLGTHFYRRQTGYDLKGRQDRDQDWSGTITRAVYDSRDRLIGTWVGTDDTPTAGDWSPSNTAGTNLIRLTTRQYDGGGVGDGNLTKSTIHTSAAAGLDTFYQYDFRNRLINERAPDKVAVQNTYDNLDRVTSQRTYADANSNFIIEAAELRERADSFFDEKSQPYQRETYFVDPATGASGNRLTEALFSNGRGYRIKARGPNGEFQKRTYDGALRVTATFTSYDDAETSYADAATVVNDRVIDQAVPTYDANGNVIQTTHYRRTSTTAKLGDLSVTWAAADSRRMFNASWFDAADRITSLVNYGTNGDVALVRPATAPAPNTSANYIVTKYGYDAGGRQSQTTDNLGRLTQTTFDGLGRETKIVENFVTGTPVETSLDTDRTTLLAYDSSGRFSQRTVLNPKGTGLGVQQQITKYIYGTTVNQAAPAVFRNDLWVAEIHPDSDDTYVPGNPAGSQLTNGTDAAYDRLEYTFDYAGRPSTIKDQRGAVRTLAYDAQGRLFTDAVTTLPAGVDGGVRRREYAYDSLSRLFTATSFNATSAGTIVNQVRHTFDGWGNTLKREDSHVGAVVVGTTPSVQTSFADGGASGLAKYVRKVSTTYPNGRVVFQNYPAAGTVGDRLSRVDNLANDAAGTVQFAQYSYIGTRTVLDVTHPLVTNGLVYRQGPDNAPGGWDRFDRQIMTKWRNTANTVTHDQYTYTYDRVGNRLTRQRGSTTAPPAPVDEFYTYDGLDRLTKQNRGALVSGTIADASANFSQKWTALESLGNWRQLQVAPTGANSYTFVQNRSHNGANEIDTDNNDANAAGASISGSGGGDWIDPTYDKSGNMKSGPIPGTETSRHWYTYDGWNRLAKVQADLAGAPGATVAEYQYDAQNQRTAKLIPNGVNWDRTDYYYSLSWQCLEERKLLNTSSKTTPATVPSFQWVWDLRYDDAPVLRDENKDGDGDCVDGTDERLFFCQDANFNTVALVNTAGTVVERYTYHAYGKVTILNGSWAAQAATVYRNEILYTGQRRDPESGLMQYRCRYYATTLGRFVNRDPLDYDAGPNLYEYVQSGPNDRTDPLGLKQQQGGGPTRGKPTKEEGAKSLEKLLPILEALCDKCWTPCAGCTKDECKDQAKLIQKALLATWNHNFDRPNKKNPAKDRKDKVGGYWCYEWAQVFKEAMDLLKIPCWKYKKIVVHPENDAPAAIHGYLALYAYGLATNDCSAFVDDGWLKKDDGLVHTPPWPNTGSEKRPWVPFPNGYDTPIDSKQEKYSLPKAEPKTGE